MSKTFEGDTYSSAGPECPKCGFTFTPDEGHYYDQSYTEDECPECKCKFTVNVTILTSWECSLIDIKSQD